MTTSATIYGTPSEEMQVPFDYEYIIKKIPSEDEEGNWITYETVMVNFVKLGKSLEFEPSDIDLDLELAIAEQLGFEVADVRIDCEPKYKVVKPITVEV